MDEADEMVPEDHYRARGSLHHARSSTRATFASATSHIDGGEEMIVGTGEREYDCDSGLIANGFTFMPQQSDDSILRATSTESIDFVRDWYDQDDQDVPQALES